MTDQQFAALYDMLERVLFVLAEVRDTLPQIKSCISSHKATS